MAVPEALGMVPVDRQEAAPAGPHTLPPSQQGRLDPVLAAVVAEGGAAVHTSHPALGGSQPAFPPLPLSSQPDLWGSQPGGFNASQPDAGLLSLPSSQDGLPGGWHGAACYGSPVKQEPLAEPAYSGGLGFGPHAADPHAAASQHDPFLKLEPHDEAELERQMGQSQLQAWSQDPPHWEEQQQWREEQEWQVPQHWEEQHWLQQQLLQQQSWAPQEEQSWAPQESQLQPQPQPPLQAPPQQVAGQPHPQNWVPQPQPQPQQWLCEMFSDPPLAAQQPQQRLEEAEAAAGCGSSHLLLSPAAAAAAPPCSKGAPADAVQPAVVEPTTTAKLAAGGSRKRKAPQPAGSPQPLAKRAAGAPAKQAAAAAVQRSKGSGGSRQPACLGGRKSPVHSTAARKIGKTRLQPRTPAEQQLQPAALVEAAAGKAGAKQRHQAQQARKGRATRPRQQAAKAACKQQRAAPKAAAAKPASNLVASKPAAGSSRGKPSSSSSSKPANKAVASKAAAGCTSGKPGSSSKAAAGGSSSKVGGSKATPGKRVRLSRPCTGRQTGRRKGGMNVPPEKLFEYHLDLLGKGGKRELAEKFETRTDSMSVKVQSFLRGLVEPKMQLRDPAIIFQVGAAQKRKPALSLDKERLKTEGITSFDAFCNKYLLPPSAEQPGQPKQPGQAKQQAKQQPMQRGKQRKP